ncbi:MAG: matrixin family metalloprotease, partial [Acidimicrobiales bacterium]
RWNPCRPILIEANFSGAPSFARIELDAAVAALRSASGMDIRFAGTTAERASSPHVAKDATQPSGWAPIRLTFATATEFPFDSPTASGYGFPKAAPDMATGRWQYITGVVVLRPTGWTQGTTSPNPLSIMLRHELGHVLGLGHVTSTQEIMTSAGNGFARAWGPGDLEGLRRVGRPAGCLPTI